MTVSRTRAIAISHAAMHEVAQLTGKDAEKVVALRRDGEIWVLEVDVVEMHARLSDDAQRARLPHATRGAVRERERRAQRVGLGGRRD